VTELGASAAKVSMAAMAAPTVRSGPVAKLQVLSPGRATIQASWQG
jgi:hypothetical protein